MQKHSNIYLCAFFTIFLFTIISSALAEGVEKTPEGHLSHTAGVYLAANQYLITLKNSECGYMISRTPLTFDDFLNSVIIPQMPLQFRAEIIESAPILKRTVDAQSRLVLQQQIYGASKIPSLDTPKSQCAFVAGVLLGIYGAVDSQFKNEKAYYEINHQ